MEYIKGSQKSVSSLAKSGWTLDENFGYLDDAIDHGRNLQQHRNKLVIIFTQTDMPSMYRVFYHSSLKYR